jgi:acyl-CoA reductase-like NAD-dependent aldehyde dehydrogenase
LPDLGVDETKAAIDAAYVAQKDWAAKTGKERASVLRKLYDLMVANADDLGAILTAEMGKPLAEAKGEILYGASFIRGSPRKPSASMATSSRATSRTSASSSSNSRSASSARSRPGTSPTR